MTKSLSLIVATAAALFLSGCNEKNEETKMIKIIDVEKVISQSSFLSQENEHLSKVKDTLLAGKKAAENTYVSMAKEDAEKAALADKLLLENSWGQQKRQARAATLAALFSTVEQYRAEQKITLVANKNVFIAADNSTDISDEIITLLKDQQIKYAALPEVSTRDASAEPENAGPEKAETPQ